MGDPPKDDRTGRTPVQVDSARVVRSQLDTSRPRLILTFSPDRSLPAVSDWADRVAIGRLNPERSEVGRLSIDDERMSRNHARIDRSEAGFVITEQASTNGSFLNGRPLAPKFPIPLAEGDVLRFGDSIFVFRQGSGAAPAGDRGDDLPGIAPAVVAARAAIDRAASSRSPILLLGETGTGKEYAARRLHRLRAGASAPFVPVNCGELSKALSRTELFGAAKGAYTDAHEARPGLVSEARDGTLFLDEVGDLPMEAQVELLRFLEDGTYRSVGSRTIERSTASVVAATNVDIEGAVAAGRFRLDLLARLRTFIEPIELPPLRDRREDLLEWVRRFLPPEAGALGFSPGFVEAILVHAWPENLRGLRAAVASSAAAARAANASVLLATHLPKSVTATRESARELESTPSPAAPAIDPRNLGREEVTAALASSNGVARQAALKLGIDRRRLYRLCEELGIDLASFRAPRAP